MTLGHRPDAALGRVRPGVVALAALLPWRTRVAAAHGSLRIMRLVALSALLGLAHVAVGHGSVRDAEIPAAQGFVTDTADVIDPSSAAAIAVIAEELRQRTGAEIAILTVPTTGEESTFDYAMRVAESWRVGSKDRDEGVLIVVAVADRRLQILTGYGVEGALPDGWVGELRDTVLGPAFRGGRYGPGLLAATDAIARRVAADRGVELSGLAPAAAPPPEGDALGAVALLFFLILFALVSTLGQRLGGQRGSHRQTSGAWGSAAHGSTFGSGRGGFGGFGGGSFGGGGAGGSW